MMRRSKYDLAFHREDDGVWYVDFPDWPFAHHNLAMVGGADKLCSYLADGKRTIRVEVIACKHRYWFRELTSKRMDMPRHAVCVRAVSEVSLFEEDIKALMHLHKSEKFTLNLMSV